jgi:hypothetical protein
MEAWTDGELKHLKEQERQEKERDMSLRKAKNTIFNLERMLGYMYGIMSGLDKGDYFTYPTNIQSFFDAHWDREKARAALKFKALLVNFNTFENAFYCFVESEKRHGPFTTFQNTFFHVFLADIWEKSQRVKEMANEKQTKIDNALAKLTEEEKKLLGVKINGTT